MAHPVIRYSSVSGSDTAASGAPHDMTAVTNVTSGQTVTGAGSGTSITFSAAVDLTGIANDGSDVIFVNHGLDERYLFAITGITGTVAACTGLTVTGSVGATGFSGASWAIGGLRKEGRVQDGVNGASVHIEGHDYLPGWVAELTNGETYETGDNTSGLVAGETQWEFNYPSVDINNPITIRAVDPTDQANLPRIVCDQNLTNRSTNYGSVAIHTPYVIVDGIEFERTVSSWLGTYFVEAYSLNFVVRRCRFVGDGGSCAVRASYGGGFVIEDNYISMGGPYVTVCINLSGGRPNSTIQRNVIDMTRCTVGTGIGISLSGNSYSYSAARDNLIIGGQTGVSVYPVGAKAQEISGNTFYGQNRNGILIQIDPASASMLRIHNNIFSNAGQYGIEGASGISALVYRSNNHFHNNTSGNYSHSVPLNETETFGDPQFVSTVAPFNFTPQNLDVMNQVPTCPAGAY